MSSSITRTRSNSYLDSHAKNVKMLLDQCPAEGFHDLKAFDAAVGNKPLFTRQVMKDAAANIEQIRDLMTRFDPIFVPLAVGGDGRVMLNPSEEENEQMGWVLSFRTSCVLAANLADQNGRYHLYGVLLKADLTATYTFKPDDHDSNVIRQEIVRTLPPLAELKHMSELHAQLLASPVWAETKKLLVTFPTRIDNIVCLALGGSDAQHVFACALAEFLEGHYSKNNGSNTIPIVTYDPSYTEARLRLLAHLRRPITVVSTPYEYLSITPRSLVMSLGLPRTQPAFEIIADSLFPSGPAAMLCTEFLECPWHAEGKAWIMDARIPRVAKMLEQYEVDWLGHFVEKSTLQTRGDWSWLHHVVWYSRKEWNIRDRIHRPHCL